MKAAVLVFPGSNRDRDAARALRLAGADVSTVWHADAALPLGTDLVVLPGGFAYGDYLRCGAIAARAPIMDAVRAHAAKGGLVLGICNGFQILCESGLLPGALMRNAGLRFICHRQHLRVERADTAFTGRYRAGEAIDVCVAHGEGNFAADPDTLARLEGEGRVVARYLGSNPNGSVKDIAAIANERGNVVGIMPHPEHAVEDLTGPGTDGLVFFTSVLTALVAA